MQNIAAGLQVQILRIPQIRPSNASSMYQIGHSDALKAASELVGIACSTRMEAMRSALKQATDHAEWCANEAFGGKGIEVEKMRRYWASDEPAIYAQWLMWKEVLGEKVEACDE